LAIKERTAPTLLAASFEKFDTFTAGLIVLAALPRNSFPRIVSAERDVRDKMYDACPMIVVVVPALISMTLFA
jgi:hypothetical protein